jgi:polysaccharide biosynthesis/export protein
MSTRPKRFTGTIVALNNGQQAGHRQAVIRWMLGAILFLPTAAAAEEYLLAPGDVLRVMIVASPGLSVEVPIEMDGTAWFPLVGQITAGGATLQDVRERTADAYASMSLSQPVFSGAGLPLMLVESQVHVSVASYRPIYITGDVGPTREFPFRAGMTLRHLLALASATPARNTSRQASAGEIEAAATAVAYEYAQIWRQKSFLGIASAEDYDRIFVTRGTAFEDLVAVERSILNETLAEIDAQKQNLKEEITRVEARIAVLGRQKDNETEGLALDEQDLATVQDLFSRNLVPASRLTEVRRSTLVTASRVSQIDAALETAKGQVATLKANILAIDSDARVQAWNSLGEAVARIQLRRSDLESLLVAEGASPLEGVSAAQTEVTVFRSDVALSQAEVLPSLVLLPGDIVEVRRLPYGADVEATESEANQ